MGKILPDYKENSNSTVECDDWHGCYKKGWGGILTKEAFAHPAKVSFSLAERIYQHTIEEQWLRQGMTVLDPFAGIGGFAFHALKNGLHFVGIELEPRFCDLGSKNITLWNDSYSQHFTNWGTARILQGDSRHLLEVIKSVADASISSPPYAETQVKFTHMTSTSRTDPNDPHYRPSWVKKMQEGYADSERPYGETPGQLGELEDKGYDAAISSPPYAETRIDGKGDEGSSGLRNEDGSFLRGSEGWQKRKEMGERYGETEGNLGNLKDNGFDAAISSPPFLAQSGGTNVTSKEGPLADERLLKRHAAGNAATEAYGDDPANLGNLPPEGYDAAISSPPYSDGCRHTGGTDPHPDRVEGGMQKRSLGIEGDQPTDSYGDTPGNLGNLSPKGYDAAISSPPFAESNPDGGWQLLGKYAEEGRLTVKQVDGDPNKSYPSWSKDRETPYAMSPENLGNMQDRGFDAAVSSPPFGSTEASWASKKFNDPEKLAEDIERKYKDGTMGGHPASKEAILRSLNKANEQTYGETPGNLGNMEAEGFDAAVSSPPYANQDKGYGDRPNRWDKVKDNPNFKGRSHWENNDRPSGYGDTPGNLDQLKDNGFDSVISSPPYAETEVAADLKSGVDVEERKKKRSEGEWEGYNRQNPGNLGSLKADAYTEAALNHMVTKEEQPETFWQAARTIIDQTYAALKPGGIAIWVTKSFVKNGKRVNFPMQWQRMCEAAGFVTLHRHRAWLVEDRGSQYDIFGNLIEKKVERKSFFRRLAEKKGSPRIDYECVTCMMKPE